MKSMKSFVAVLAIAAGTFTIKADASLPVGYKALDWIQSTGRQCIGTGVIGTGSTRVEMTFSHVVKSPRSALFGETWSDGGLLLCTQNDSFEFWSTGIKLMAFSEYDPEAICTFAYDGANAVLTQGETEVCRTAATKALTQSGKELMVFGLGIASDRSSCRVYRMKITSVAEADSRDFVPCRNPSGEAGLYDVLNGRFYGNIGREDAFIGSDQTAEVMLNWIQSDGNQYVVTDLEGLSATAVDFRFSHATYKNRTVFFGEDKWTDQGFLFCMQTMGADKFQFWADQTDLLLKTQYDASIPYDFHLGGGYVSLTPGSAPKSVTRICDKTTDRRISVFGTSSGTDKGSFRFHGMKVWASEGGALQGDVRPYRADGRIGMRNLADGSEMPFYANRGTGAFTYGIAYSTNGTTLCAHDGTLEPADVVDWPAVEKVSAGTLAAGAVTAFPGDLKLTGGTYSLKDGEARAQTVAGTLTLKGGARLSVDLTSAGCDSLVAQTVVFEDADAAHPVEIAVLPTDITELGENEVRTVIPGIAATDLDKFKLVTGLAIELVVREGGLALVAAPRSRVLPAGYTSLAYVVSTGGQVVKTGVEGLRDTIAEMSFGGLNYANGTVLLGEGEWNAYCYLLNLQSNAIYYHSSGVKVWNSVPSNADFRAWIGDGKVILTSADVSTTNVIDNAVLFANRELAVFALNDGTRGSSFKFYSLRIAASDGRLLRDFAPCRNPAGEAGLWDYVSESFFPNTGTERLLGPDDAGAYLSWVQSDGNQYVVTDLEGQSATAVDFRFSHATYKNRTVFFGEDKWTDQGFLFCMQTRNGAGKLQFWAEETDLLLASEYDVNLPYDFHLGNGTVSLATGDARVSLKTVRNICDKTADKRISVFGTSAGTDKGTFRFHGMKVWASEGGELRGDVRPYRSADGRIGLYNATTSTFYPNLGTSNLSWGGIVYTWSGTTLNALEGTLAESDVADWEAVEKTSSGTLAAGAVTNYPGALTLTQGLFSLADGTVRRHEVAGTLTLKGGARLAVDMTADGCDTFAAASIVLDTTATAESPVTLEIGANIAALPDGASLEVFPGVTFADGDAERFVVSGFPARLRVENGALVLVPRAAGLAEWTGAAQNGKWSAAHNWVGDTLPVSGASVLFDTASGGETLDDLAGGGRFAALTFGPNAGAFVHGGSTPLTVQAALTNRSEAAQTLAMPLELGLANETFLVDAVSSLSLAGGVEMAGAALVKTGAGTLTIDDTAIAQVTRVEISGGTVRLNPTGRQKGISAGGEIHIAAGARLDVNVNQANADSLEKNEAVHGKEVFIAGDGPDGAGALYNSDFSDKWGATFSRLVLTGDASMGGGYLSVRPLAGSAAGATSVSVAGGYTLTARFPTNRTEMADIDRCEFALHRFDVRGGFQFSFDLTGTITNGVHLFDGSLLRVGNSCVLHEGIPLVADAGTSRIITFAGGSAQSFMGGLTVRPDAVLDLNNVNPVSMEGAIVIDGTLRGTGSAVTTLKGTLSGTGTITGGNLRFGAGSRWTMTANDDGFVAKADIDGVTDAAFLAGLGAIDVTYAGANPANCMLRIGPAGSLTADQARQIALTVRDGESVELPNCWLEVTATGDLVLHIADSGLVRTAVWAGDASSRLDDPGCWVCSNDAGRVEGAIPRGETRVFLPEGCAITCTNGAPFVCASVVLPNAIGGDCDWRGLGVEQAITNTITLNGHTLTLDRLVGNGSITDGDYLPLDYIESTGTQYLPLGVDGNEDTTVELAFSHMVNQPAAALFATGKWSWNGFIFCTQNNHFEYCSGQNDLLAYADYDPEVRYTLRTCDYNSNARTVRAVISSNGVELASMTVDNTVTVAAGKREIALFGMNDGTSGRNSQCRIHAMKVWDGTGTLQRDLIPVRRVSDGAVGLLDVKGGGREFLSAKNVGSATAPLLAGPVRHDLLASVGTVRLVTDGATENTSVALKGALRFVKAGAGTFTATKTGQTYVGGNEIVAGTFKCGDTGTSGIYGSSGATNTVRAGAIFDFNQHPNQYGNVFVLDGGKLKSSKTLGSSDAWFTDVVLTADSSIEGMGFGFVGPSWAPSTLEMNGHTLSLLIPGGADSLFYMGNLTVTGGGRIVCPTGGYLVLGGNAVRTQYGKEQFTGDTGKYVYAETTTLEMPDSGAALFDRTTADGQIRFLNYQSAYNWDYNRGTGAISVLGRFTPGPIKWHSACLGNGATLDLSGASGAWNATCTYQKKDTAVNDATLTFADNATIYIDLGKRRLARKEKIIDWSAAKPTNLSTLKFELAPGSRRGGGFYVCDDGLYYHSGFVIYITQNEETIFAPDEFFDGKTVDDEPITTDELAQAYMDQVEANGLKAWQNYAMGIEGVAGNRFDITYEKIDEGNSLWKFKAVITATEG